MLHIQFFIFSLLIFLGAHNDEEFFDTVEDLDDLSDDERSNSTDPQIHLYKTRLGAVYKKRAVIRNKKVYSYCY